MIYPLVTTHDAPSVDPKVIGIHHGNASTILVIERHKTKIAILHLSFIGNSNIGGVFDSSNSIQYLWEWLTLTKNSFIHHFKSCGSDSSHPNILQAFTWTLHLAKKNFCHRQYHCWCYRHMLFAHSCVRAREPRNRMSPIAALNSSTTTALHMRKRKSISMWIYSSRNLILWNEQRTRSNFMQTHNQAARGTRPKYYSALHV